MTPDQLAAGLAGIAGDLGDLEAAELAAAGALLDQIRPKVPRRTGRLYRSGQVARNPVRATFGGTAAPYAPYVDARRPFMAAADPDTAVQIITDAVADAVARNL